MKKILTFMFASALVAFTACAQQPKASPPAKATGKAGNANITITYSQPSVKGRVIFGDLVPYGKVWRTGANEATIFETDSDIMVEGKKLAAGKYALFTIPGEKSWTIVFNKTWNQWGSFKYKEDDDVLRVEAKPQPAPMTEQMTFTVANSKVRLAWDKTAVEFSVK
ncbi:MAG TPA: DUF2911 domain-containing protein [Chitinophagaceae bacterium]|nr:DUF2911 domain-containing protein [Chitinophagaceae bacterium]